MKTKYKIFILAIISNIALISYANNHLEIIKKENQTIIFKDGQENLVHKIEDIWGSSEVTIQPEIIKFGDIEKIYVTVNVGLIDISDKELFEKNKFQTRKISFKNISNLKEFNGIKLIYKISESEQKEAFILDVIDKLPIAKGCDENLSRIEMKKCFSDRISKHVEHNFTYKKYKDLDLEKKKYKIITQFNINKKSKIDSVVVYSDNEMLRKRITKVIQSMKIKKTGYNNGKPVNVKYRFPIYFTVE